jgi:hypothetical protein
MDWRMMRSYLPLKHRPHFLLILAPHTAVIRYSEPLASHDRRAKMKTVRYLLVAAALGCASMTRAQAHMFVGVGFSAPMYPVMPAVPMIAATPVYAPPPPVYYAPPPVVAGYYGRPYGYGYAYPRHYGCWNCGYWAR